MDGAAPLLIELYADPLTVSRLVREHGSVEGSQRERVDFVVVIDDGECGVHTPETGVEPASQS